jgi:hypothetical protein
VDTPDIQRDPIDNYKEQPEPTPLEWPKEEPKAEGEEGEGGEDE